MTTDALTKKILVPVLLCGGSGARLWPLSRKLSPKQFLKIGDEHSLFQKTLMRCSNEDIYEKPYVIANEELKFIILEQAEEVGIELGVVLLEPSPRNTAPAIAAAAFHIAQSNSKSSMHVMPSDHFIEDDEYYRESLKIAINTAALGHFVTFGIEPTRPATGYGYVKLGKKVTDGSNLIEKFVEKPNLTAAQDMLKTGKYCWNSGMFVLPVKEFLKELKEHEPALTKTVGEAVKQSTIGNDTSVKLSSTYFKESPDISVDYALFERTKKAAVVPSRFSWSDIGSWFAFWESQESDDDQNVVHGNATLQHSKNNIVVSGNQHVALNGVDNLSIVATDDAILVSSISESENVKALVELLKSQEETFALTETHKTVHRPWGGYSSLYVGERFQIKRLFVTPGKMLSLQKHFHRSEHWVVVAGTAEVTVDDEISTLTENESIFIPLGAKHRLYNPGKILLEIIEVQIGSYLGEDDIVRIEDTFGRV